MRLVGIKATTMTSGKNEGKTGYTYSFMKEYTDYEKDKHYSPEGLLLYARNNGIHLRHPFALRRSITILI